MQSVSYASFPRCSFFFFFFFFVNQYFCRPKLVIAHNTPNEKVEGRENENASHEVDMVVDPDLFVGNQKQNITKKKKKQTKKEKLKVKQPNKQTMQFKLLIQEIGEASDITIGKFVSFRYSGEQRRVGPPMNPRVSQLNPLPHSFSFELFLLFLIFI